MCDVGAEWDKTQDLFEMHAPDFLAGAFPNFTSHTMHINITSPLLGPFSAHYELRTHVDEEEQHYAFPIVEAREMPLLKALEDIPALGQALARLTLASQETPRPLVLATGLSCAAVQDKLPTMLLSKLAAVYLIPADWATVAPQLACKDIDFVFGMPDLDMHGQRPRAARTLNFPEKKTPTTLIMNLGVHDRLVETCSSGSMPGFVGRFVPQFVVCGNTVIYGGFFYDDAHFQLQVCGTSSMSGHAVDTESEEYKAAQAEAELVGKEPWRYRSWPQVWLDSLLVEATCI